jgi:hypothetical protein
VEIDRIVPVSGNMFAAGRQGWLGKPLAGQKLTRRLDHMSLHVFHCSGSCTKGTQLAVCARTAVKKVTCRSASGHVTYQA